MGRDNNVKASGGGIGFFGVLGIVFIVLKLLHVIDWPWIWVLCPIWGSIALTIIILIIAGIFLTRGKW